MKFLKLFTMTLLILCMAVLSACGQNNGGNAAEGTQEAPPETGNATEEPKPLEKVKIQLLWVAQAQFAGIYVAKDKGFYEEEGIEIEIIPGGPDTVSEQQVANGVVDVAVSAVDSLLVNRDKGIPLVSIGQIIQKNSKYLIAKKSTGIDTPEKMKGKKVSAFMGGRQFPIVAFLEKYGINTERDINFLKQGYTMDQFLNDDVDVATVTSYNEYNVVLSSGIAESDLNIFSVEEAGIGMLEDTLIVREDWLEQNRDLAARIVRATMKGWNYAIDHQEEAIDIVMNNVVEGSTTEEHQAAMLREMAKLVRPEGFTNEQVGMFVEEAFQRTADISLQYGLIEKAPDISEVYDASVYQESLN